MAELKISNPLSSLIDLGGKILDKLFLILCRQHRQSLLYYKLRWQENWNISKLITISTGAVRC